MAYLQGEALPTFVRMEVAPATGSSTTIRAPFNHLFYTDASTRAAQTVVLPTSPEDGQLVVITTKSQITALTLSPTAVGSPVGLVAGSNLWLMWSSTLPGWFAIVNGVTP
jgi:hypothetical protein